MEMFNENENINPLEARNRELQYAIYDLLKQWVIYIFNHLIFKY